MLAPTKIELLRRRLQDLSALDYAGQNFAYHSLTYAGEPRIEATSPILSTTMTTVCFDD
jgi:hypothetical protein